VAPWHPSPTDDRPRADPIGAPLAGPHAASHARVSDSVLPGPRSCQVTASTTPLPGQQGHPPGPFRSKTTGSHYGRGTDHYTHALFAPPTPSATRASRATRADRATPGQASKARIARSTPGPGPCSWARSLTLARRNTLRSDASLRDVPSVQPASPGWPSAVRTRSFASAQPRKQVWPAWLAGRVVRVMRGWGPKFPEAGVF
jgi:hypothetical protein